MIVLGTAALAYAGRLAMWELYSMVLLLGVGFAIYWSTTNALVQELVPREKLIAANATVLIAVQGGMTAAGALVGFTYEHSGLAGILGIDGTTYLISAICLLLLRHGYYAPHETLNTRLLSLVPDHRSAPGNVRAIVASQRGRGTWGIGRFRGDRGRIAVFAAAAARAGFGNHIRVHDGRSDQRECAGGGSRERFAFHGRTRIRIHRAWVGPSGAIIGGLSAGTLARKNPYRVLILALATLAVGHTLFPYAHLLAIVVAMNALFGVCRALGGVLTQSSIMNTVPRYLMGRTQSAFSVIATVLQVIMSFTLGKFAERRLLCSLAFLLLGAIYGGAVLAAACARALSLNPPEPVTPTAS